MATTTIVHNASTYNGMGSNSLASHTPRNAGIISSRPCPRRTKAKSALEPRRSGSIGEPPSSENILSNLHIQNVQHQPKHKHVDSLNGDVISLNNIRRLPRDARASHIPTTLTFKTERQSVEFASDPNQKNHVKVSGEPREPP